MLRLEIIHDECIIRLDNNAEAKHKLVRIQEVLDVDDANIELRLVVEKDQEEEGETKRKLLLETVKIAVSESVDKNLIMGMIGS